MDYLPPADAAKQSAATEPGLALAAAVARSMAVHRVVYPEASEGLASLAADLADVLGLAGAAREALMAAVAPAAPARQADAPDCAVREHRAATAGISPGEGGQPGAPDTAQPVVAQVAGTQGHLCLGCGCQIAEDLREIRVPGRRGGVRYRHESSDDCADALRAPQPNRALIGRYRPTAGSAWGRARRGPQPARRVH